MGREALPIFLVFLILTSLYVSLLVIPFGSVASGILRFLGLIFGSYAHIKFRKCIFTIFFSSFLLIATVTSTSSFAWYVVTMLFIGLFHLLPMFYIFAFTFAPYQSFKDFIAEKKKMKKKDQKLLKILFIK